MRCYFCNYHASVKVVEREVTFTKKPNESYEVEIFLCTKCFNTKDLDTL